MSADDPLAQLLNWLQPAWQRDALCREHPDVNFFPERGESPIPARAICARCTVRTECLQAALDGDELGVWGGTTRQNRDAGELDPPLKITAGTRYTKTERLRIALEMRAAGHNRWKIARTIGSSPAAVKNLLHRHDTAERERLAS
ncbi:MAG: hypothetical protein F2534_15090 [Actinobacteria bacterium]|nr:hypothetical protein [Actinomycetota bacterium]